MSDLAFAVREFVPDAADPDLNSRIGLLKARDYAAGLLGVTGSDSAYDLAHMAHDVAGRFCYADVPPVRLELALKFCRHAVQAAFLADHLDWEGAGNE